MKNRLITTNNSQFKINNSQLAILNSQFSISNSHLTQNNLYGTIKWQKVIVSNKKFKKV